MKKTITALLMIIYSLSSTFGQKIINGTIKDVNDIPLYGVTVSIIGSTNGTFSDIEGKYIIKNINESDILVFSYLGFDNQEIKIGKQSTIDVILETGSTELEETVVVGYGVSKKIDLTGSVSSIDTEDLMNTATSNFDQALAGRMTGVQVTSSDGTPGEALNIIIRGGNSITGDNTPLYVVDGVPMESYDPASISTRDIKSFDVLKDASATAIYGARGANGVILITTNDGRSDGKTDISFHASNQIQYIPKRLEVMGPYEYVQYQQKVAWANDNYVPGSYTNMFNQYWVSPELYRNVKGTNWQDEIFRTAHVQNYNFSVSSGTKKLSIYYSGGYLDQKGTLINTSFKKYNNRLKFRSVVSDELTLNAQISYDHYIRSGMQVSGTEYNSVIRDAVVFRPVEPFYNRYGEDSDNDDQDPYLYNPVATLENTERKRTNDIIGGNLNVEYKFLRKFTLNIAASYYRNIHEESLFYGADTQQASRTSYGVNGSVTNIKYHTLTNSNTLRYDSKIGKSKYDILVGSEIQNRMNHRSYLRNTNIPTDVFGIDNLGLATTPTIATTNKTENMLLSYFGRVNYNYDNRYLATINFRADGSSKFNKDNRWGYFPSFSTAWRASEEDFLKEITNISNLKVRLGWGLTGNNRIGDFESFNLIAVSSSSGYVLGEGEKYSPGVYQSNMGVPDLKWEVTSQYNGGVDFGFFKNRINGTVDYYLKRTKDLLLNAQMAPSTGFSTVQQNVGEVENKGLEFSVNAHIIKNRDFTWSSNFNISFNRNKTIKLNSGESQMRTDPRWDVGYTNTEYQYVTRVGEPVGMIYGLEFDGLYQMDDFNWINGDTYELKPGISSYGGRTMNPGMAKFKDQPTIDTNGDGIPDKGDGVINEDDRVIIGNPHPKHTGGFRNDFTYKNFDLQVLLQWSYGFDILNANKALFSTYLNNNRNGYPELLNSWTPTNTDTNVSGVRYNGNTLQARTGFKIDSRYVDDGSFLKIKTVVVGYRLPQSILKKVKLKSCRFSLSAQNLYTFTKYKGYDPDVSVGKYGALTPSLDYSAYPQSVAVSFGVDIKF